MTDYVRRSRELAAMREIQDADVALQRACDKLSRLGLDISAAGIAGVRRELQREAALVRGALGLDDQLRRVG